MFKNIDISIIVPCYNTATKITRSLHSLEKITFPKERFEVLFIDDCSTDNTKDVINNFLQNNSNCSLYENNENSGSPSAPRNIGIKKAAGEFIFFLDSDDEILPDALEKLFHLAREENADIIRSPILVEDNGSVVKRNEIKPFSETTKKEIRIERIIKEQSTTVDSFVRTEILRGNNIEWNESLRMGEDTIFLIDVLLHSESIIYNEEPTYIYHKTVDTGATSSTQNYGQRELKNHLIIWEEAEKKLSQVGFSYFKTRGQVALSTVFKSITNFNSGDISDDLLDSFSDYISKNQKYSKKLNLSPRYKNALHFLLQKKYEEFFQILKPRLLIAGHDLKFITSTLPELKEAFTIRIDYWQSHTEHKENESEKLLKWADIIFCEWLLGNAVWYSQRKSPHQKLIVRLHRSELTANYGNQVNDNNINCYCTVGVYTLEKMLETFGMDRGKVRLIPNYLKINEYETSEDSNKVFNLGIVGILPSLKGYLNALKLLKKLKESDERYNLSVYGKQPEELQWVIKNAKERDYYSQCTKYINDNGLQNDVHLKGWVNTKKELKDIGFVISTSTVESFHIAPAEGFASGNQGVFLNWNGVEFLYPEQYIFENIDTMADYIEENSNTKKFNETKELGYSTITKRYNVSNFIEAFRAMVKEC